MLDLFLALLYPPSCGFCGKELRAAGSPAACHGCRGRLHPPSPGCPLCGEPGTTITCTRCRATPPAFSRARAAFVYGGSASESLLADALARWKYGRDLAVGRTLAAAFSSWGASLPAAVDAVVPVPLHSRRLASRGFNQASILASALARARRVPLRLAMVRHVTSVSQTRLGRDARRKNVAQGFSVRRPRSIVAQRIVLVDDVFTTGATADACAQVLLAAGARSVEVWTLARAGREISSA